MEAANISTAFPRGPWHLLGNLDFCGFFHSPLIFTLVKSFGTPRVFQEGGGGTARAGGVTGSATVWHDRDCQPAEGERGGCRFAGGAVHLWWTTRRSH